MTELLDHLDTHALLRALGAPDIPMM